MQQPRASCWLSTPPKEPQRQLSHQQFAVAVRNRLNLLPLPRGLPDACICSAKLDANTHPSHLHWCKTVRSSGCTLRHNTVVNTVVALARAAGLAPVVEPRALPKTSDKGEPPKRPDIMLYGTTDTLLVDVSLMHPLSPSYVSTHPKNDKDGTNHEQRIIRDREARKRRKYAPLAAKHDNGKVMPFVLDAYGAFGAGADDLIRWLAMAAVSNGCVARDAEYREMAYAWLAIAVQRGNGQLVDRNVSFVRAVLGKRKTDAEVPRRRASLRRGRQSANTVPSRLYSRLYNGSDR